MELYSSENPVFSGYAFYASILILKMILMSAFTGYTRYKKKAFVNTEDAQIANATIKNTDEDVERIRRAHQNDVENIPIFLVAGLLFVAADPNVVFALMVFRLFTVSRIAHTLVYSVFVVRQPARAVAFGLATSLLLIVVVILMISFPQL
ncbi:hypothetical protein AAG570_003931 [Ranatra chinensis]|uniref:Microsomal glutathione S-transferase 1 n=1 Tax=Ranatra chinensis TaxID=642074 RepID=A0ABD0Y2B6_9HEMI